ncbi:hypothetical protein [Moritella sp.]|uniref:hypothetical protein n=1 Tax=Moritella sp. TaxID=78556 RepID=UPI001D9C8013|nr:hypothetical protein [Moritella sp.]MCJ8348550.1 hypothetical protein [Moritella sp.]NQZ39065.1 hypothetical protein [Moritella sp.]
MTILFEEIRNKSKLELSNENIEHRKEQLSKVTFRNFADQIEALELANELTNQQNILDPTLTYLANQSYQSPFFVAYVFGS